MQRLIKSSPRSARDDDDDDEEELETYEDLDDREADDDPLQCTERVNVKQELLSPVDVSDSAADVDVKPNMSVLEANLSASLAARLAAALSPNEVTSSTAFRTWCEKMEFRKDNVLQVRAEAGEDGDEDVNVDESGSSDGDSKKSKLHLCPDCGVVLTNAVNRLRHRCKKFKCAECGWRGASRSMLQVHQVEEHNESRPHVCLTCRARFTSERGLREHSRMHAKRTSTCACPYCNANFNTVHNMSRHVRQCRARTESPLGSYREERKPFLCRLCLATFWKHSDVRRHVDSIHTLKLPFRCSVCVSSFSSQRMLSNHVSKVHSIPRPFTCSVCFERYAQREELLEHLQVHLTASAVKKETGVGVNAVNAVNSSQRRTTRSVTRSSTGSSAGSSSSASGERAASALDNIKSYLSDSD